MSPSGQPIITGTVQVGKTLRADTSGITDGNGLSNPGFTHQWVRNNGSADTDIPGATGSTHTLTTGDLPHTIKVLVAFTDDDGYAETVNSEATNVVSRPPNATASGQPTITGTVGVGETLSADTSGISDRNGLSNPRYTYQWVHSVDGTDTDISGATGSSYAVASSDAGRAFKVKATFTDDDGYSETLTSAATDVVLVAQQQGTSNSTVSEPDGEDLPADNTTTGRVVVGGDGATGNLDSNNDKDSFKIDLESGKRYRVDALVYAYRDVGNGGTFPGKPVVQIQKTNGSILGTGQAVRLNGYGEFAPESGDNTSSNAVNQGSGPDNGARSEFDVTETGTYLIVVDADGEGTGTYTVRASEITSEQAYGDFTSAFNGGRLEIDDSNAMTGTVGDTGDVDWFLALLEDDKCYTFEAKGHHSNSAITTAAP